MVQQPTRTSTMVGVKLRFLETLLNKLKIRPSPTLQIKYTPLLAILISRNIIKLNGNIIA